MLPETFVHDASTEKSAMFSSVRDKREADADIILRSEMVRVNEKNQMDGLSCLSGINDNVISACFFDPQYRGILDKLKYGNEGERQKGRADLSQMDDELISSYLLEINRVLQPAGHLFLWIDKFHLCVGISHWFKNTFLSQVDLITWDKGRIGMGYRTRRKAEYLLILQKAPVRAKGVWIKHNIPDVWIEKIIHRVHPHQKPFELQKNLISAVVPENGYVIDPCAGSYSVMDACKVSGCNFIGSDIRTISYSGMNSLSQ